MMLIFLALLQDSENYSVLLKQIAPVDAYVDSPQSVVSVSIHQLL